MIDRCGRNIDYLRISVTDRCNLRCIYCMPEEGVQHVERSLILQEEEILRICRVMAELGIRKIKLTGGEPLVRPRMPQLVEKLKNMPGIEKVTLTTNGVLLKDQMSDFARAGLDGLNISLDTLDEACSRRITRRDELGRTLEGISEALKYPGISLKINCVPLGIPDQDLCKVAFLARDHKVHVRFIEMMPIGMGKEFHGVSEEELLGILGEKLPRFSPYVGEPLGNGPCHYYDVDGSKHILTNPNSFARGLRMLMTKGRPYLALDIDMLNKTNSTTTMKKYSEYLQGFTELSAYKDDDDCTL